MAHGNTSADGHSGAMGEFKESAGASGSPLEDWTNAKKFSPSAFSSQMIQCLQQLQGRGKSMKQPRSIVLSMRLPVESGRRLKRMANRHGWTPSDASARLVEEGLRRSEFAFLDFRDSPAGRQAYIQGSSLAIWEVILLLRSYKGNIKDVAKHLNWPEAKVRAALNYSEAFPGEVNELLAENDSTDFDSLKRMLPQAVDFAAKKTKRG
jgi:hypothetical protein